MSEEKLESFLRDFGKAFVERDVEKMLSFFAENGVFVSPEGTFKGKEELRRYWTWNVKVNPNVKLRDTGVGIVVKGNKIFHELIVEGVTPEGRKFEIPGMDVYEISEGKIQQKRSFYDRLSVAKQVAKGWLENTIINVVINRMEKGLH
jgi:ketosteroid isomerase-like protein